MPSMVGNLTATPDPVVDAALAPPPRKRRRRTAASGATDDCFTCRKRAIPCDRKRPYCTPCIEIGKECSGYKTTLTWGVGVASRGKLRGQALPVANTRSSEPSKPRSSPEEARRRKTPAAAKVKTTPPMPPAPPAGGMAYQMPLPAPATSMPTSVSPVTPAASSLPMSIPIPSPQQGWQLPSYHHEPLQPTPFRADGFRHSSLGHPSLQRLQTAIGPQYDSPSRSASSAGSYTDASEYRSPADYPRTPGSVHFSDPFTAGLTSNPNTSLGSSLDSLHHHSAAAAAESYKNALHPPMDSIPHETIYHDNGTIGVTSADLRSYSNAITGQNALVLSPMNSLPIDLGYFSDAHGMDDEQALNEESLAILDPRFSSPFFHVTPRMQSLMEYYDRYVCPFLVAFDGSENPYRRHILQLAFQSEGLQNAIAALAANNMRMRKDLSPRPIGFVEEIPERGERARKGRSTKDASPEESCYKQLSIDQLNMQLASKSAAQDDSVLATLLILCLYHVCDSGFTKFKTQLAGMQKLLALRSGQSDFTSWVEMFFIWFDVMTSTVNDREMQIHGESLNMLDYTANLGVLEQFSGCDGRLFKLIARLGRLNLLAQGRPVRPLNGVHERPPGDSKFRRSLSASDYDGLDGNGWAMPVVPAGQDYDVKGGLADDRQEFWHEWNTIRTRLHAWEIDPNSRPNASPRLSFSRAPPDMDANHRDLVHINESFRYAALIYTERLGYPTLPSSHPTMQELVSSALYHITALPITSCVNKFLLWPLFMTGTECVDEAHRNIVRTRCIELSKESGFYNNMSGLEVLEKVWKDAAGTNLPGSEAAEIHARQHELDTERRNGRYPQVFRWRKAMDRVDGEYIVI